MQTGGLGLYARQLLGIGSQMSKKPIKFIADMWVYSIPPNDSQQSFAQVLHSLQSLI